MIYYKNYQEYTVLSNKTHLEFHLVKKNAKGTSKWLYSNSIPKPICHWLANR